jgi:hypothetical protein
MIWGDIAKMLQKLPGASLSRNFLGPAQDQEKGERAGNATAAVVITGLVPVIHVFPPPQSEDVDGRDKPGHDRV